jgi:hypothetical protein
MTLRTTNPMNWSLEGRSSFLIYPAVEDRMTPVSLWFTKPANHASCYHITMEETSPVFPNH